MSSPEVPARPPSRFGFSTLSSPTVRRAFRMRIGAVAIVLLAIAVVIDRVIASAVADLAEDQVTSLAQTTAANLRDWFEKRRALAGVLASHPVVRESALAVLDGNADAPERLSSHLAGFAEQFEIDGYSMCAPDGTIVFAKEGVVPGMRVAEQYADAVRLSLGGTATIHPPSTHSFRGAATLAITATAPVSDGAAVRGVLSIRFEPRGGYMRLFEAARPGETGETYAVTAEGRLASRSRFLDELRAAGLVPSGMDTAILQIDVRDPGGALADVPATDRSKLPLTRAAAEVTAGRAGADAGGYRDYRGEPVVGAWVPVPEFGLGVITEMDVSEAFRPLWRLRLVFGALILLLGGAGVAATVTLRRSEVASRRAAQAEQKLRELGQYTLERKLGEGGMGAVYLATHRVLRRRTAVKLIRGETSPDAVRRFEREAQITCHLTHPNTVALYDYGTAADGTLYFAMEYLRGRDMAHLVSEFGPLPPARVVHLLAQVAGSLAEAHAAKLIHRDIKPANLYVCERGGIHDFVKVLDFGIAKGIQPGAGETAPGAIIGTPLYLAPECVLGRSPADGRSDLYSLGCVAWYLLTGTNLFARENAVAVVMAQVNDPVPPLAPSVPGGLAPDLERVVLGLLAKSPDHRPATAAQLLRDLRACADWGRWTEDDARDWWEQHPLPERPADSDDGPPSVPTILTTHGPI